MGLGGAGSSPGRRPRIRIVMPPSSTKICGAPRATVSRAIVAPNISTYHSAEARGFSLMMCTWSNLNAGLLMLHLSQAVIASEAKQSPADARSGDGDCFVASLLAMTDKFNGAARHG